MIEKSDSPILISLMGFTGFKPYEPIYIYKPSPRFASACAHLRAFGATSDGDSASDGDSGLGAGRLRLDQKLASHLRLV